MPKLKCPYTFPHKSRKAKVDYLTDIGGYHSRHDSYPLEFNVAAYADLDFETLWKLLLEERQSEYSEGTTSRALFEFAARKAYADCEDRLWSWALEDAQRTVLETDAYTTLWDGTSLDVKLGFHGRGGKHLCIESFEGITLRGLNPDSLGELLMCQNGPGGEDVLDAPRLKKGFEWQIPGERVDLLYRYVRQCEIDFTSSKAEAEVEYQAAYHLGQRADELYVALFGDTKESVAAKLTDDARALLAALPNLTQELAESFARLCTAAGLGLGDTALNLDN